MDYISSDTSGWIWADALQGVALRVNTFPQPSPTVPRKLRLILAWEKAVGLEPRCSREGKVLTSASFSPAGPLLSAPPHPLAGEQLPRAETVAERGEATLALIATPSPTHLPTALLGRQQ